MTIADTIHAPVRSLAGAVFAAAALLGAGAVVPREAAASQLAMTYYSSTVWAADPDAARVHVSSYVTATSHAADVSGRRGFYSTLEMTLPRSIADLSAALSDGTPRPVAVEGQSSAGTVVSISLGRRLYADQSISLGLTFDLVDNGGSTTRDLRLGHSIMSFPVVAFGSPGTPGSTVTVEFPDELTVQEDFGSLTRSLYAADRVVFTSGTLDDPSVLSAWFTAAQPVPPSDFRSRSITVGGMAITLRYWVDDPGWADAVADVLERGLPILHDLIGLGWPAIDTLTVTEATAEETGGAAGDFNVDSGQVQVSYLADPFVILHEAAHLWFNDRLVDERWIEEGFASYYAERAVLTAGMTDNAPTLDESLLDAAVPFNDWVTPGVPNSATEKYLYAATLQVSREIAAIAGPTALQTVWRDAHMGWTAYQPGILPTETQAGPIDWQGFLDLLETASGQSFESLFNQWVVTPSQASLLSQRLASRHLYNEAVAQAAPWSLPPEIRRNLDSWHFDQADDAMAQALAVVAARHQIAAAAAKELTTPPDTLQKLFEDSTVAAAANEATAELDALDAISAAAKAHVQGGGAVTLLAGGDPASELQAAREAFAAGNLDAATASAQDAERIWQGGYSAQLVRTLGLAVGTIGLLTLLCVGLAAVARRRREREFAGAAVAVAVETSLPGSAGPVLDEADALPDEAEAAGEVAEEGATDRVPILAISRHSDLDAGDDGDRNPFGPDYGLELNAPGESAYELLQRGTALLRDRHNAQAAVVLERAARVQPGKGSILEALGRAYFNSGQHLRAAETFEALLEVDPSAHYGHFALGMSFARLGREAEARTHLRLAVALDPRSETYRRALERYEAKA